MFTEPPPHPSIPYIAQDRMSHPKVALLTKILSQFDLEAVLASTAGLMTVPALRAHAVRLELLSQAAVAACSGNKYPTPSNLDRWLNYHLGVPDISNLEDPPEDVFIANVLSKAGEQLIFETAWEASSSSTTALLAALETAPPWLQPEWLASAIALLRLSDEVVRRAGLKRWDSAESIPKVSIPIPDATELARLGKRVTLTWDELEALRIVPDDLRPFEFNLSTRTQILAENSAMSSLHRYPLVRSESGSGYILSLPYSVTVAVRVYLIECVQKFGQLPALTEILMVTALEKANYLLSHGSRHSMTRVDLPQQLRGIPGVCASLVAQVGKRRFMYVLLVADDLEQFAAITYTTHSELSSAILERVIAHLETVQQFVEETYEVDSGHTFLAMGLLGQPFAVSKPSEKPLWTFTLVRLNDLETLVEFEHDIFDELILLLNERRSLEEQGLEIVFDNGILNLYAYWISERYSLRGRDIPPDANGLLNIAINYVEDLRTSRRRRADVHCVQHSSGAQLVVTRAQISTPYRGMRLVPTYVPPSLLRQGILAFVYERGSQRLWVSALPPEDESARHVVFELWDYLQMIAHRAFGMPQFDCYFVDPIVEITLDFRWMKGHEEALADTSSYSGLDLRLRKDKKAARIEVGPAFLREFAGVKNNGECLFTEVVLQAINVLMDRGLTEQTELTRLALEALGGAGARFFHLFAGAHNFEQALERVKRKAFEFPREHVESAKSAAFSSIELPSRSTPMSAPESVALLNACVERHVGKICEKLSRVSRPAILSELLLLNETLLRERRVASRTARAVLSIHAEDGLQAAQRAEHERANMNIVLRALVEAAQCECPDQGGRIPDPYEIDELFGLMDLIVTMGRDSDAIQYGLAPLGIVLHSSGAYHLRENSIGEIVNSFMRETFSQGFASAAEGYEQWVYPRDITSERKLPTAFDASKFRDAWRAEFGHSLDAFQELNGEILDRGSDTDSPIITLTPNELYEKRKDAGVTREDVRGFLSYFGLPRRPKWNSVPSGFKFKDIFPWRFERRLSLSLRPFVSVGDEQMMYGVSAAHEALGYIVTSLYDASFDKDVFKSKEMRSWLGGRVDELGAEFTEAVAQLLRDEGWTARTEVKMTELGAKKPPDLGDIDVLAWKDDRAVLAIECKRLKQSRTIAEIASCLKSFAGNVDDRLRKHLRRIDWLNDNPAKLEAIVGRSGFNLKGLLVVNRPVPFQFRDDLAIPADEIVQIDHLGAFAKIALRASSDEH